MTENIYPTYHELCKSAPILARKAIIKAYEETRNISEVARLFQTTRKTVRQVWRRWKERGGAGFRVYPEGPSTLPGELQPR